MTELRPLTREQKRAIALILTAGGSAIAIMLGMLAYLDPAWIFGGNICTTTQNVVATCGVPPVGMVAAIVAGSIVAHVGFNVGGTLTG